MRDAPAADPDAAIAALRGNTAAFVAGLLFCLAPERMTDTGHPFIHGDLWAPLLREKGRFDLGVYV